MSALRSAFSAARAATRRNVSTSAVVRSDAIMMHQDSKHNNANIRFEWTPESLEQIKTVVARYPPQYKKAAVMPVLDIAQRQNGGWVSLSAMNEVARTLEMPPMRVYEINDDYYEDLTPETAVKVLEALGRGEKPKAGPQSGRQTSENSAGLTTLTTPPYGPGDFCQPEFK